MVSWPATVPEVVGSNCTYKVAVWPGLRVTGKVAPEIEKPAPLTAAVLILTDAVPVEESARD